MGSIDFTATARSVLVIGTNPEDDSQRVIVQNKSNLAEKPKSAIFQIVEGRFEWCGFSEVTADEVLASKTKDSSISSELNEAIAFLSAYEVTGLVSSDLVTQQAEQLGICKTTLYRAKKKLNIPSKKQGKEWFYVFPE